MDIRYCFVSTFHDMRCEKYLCFQIVVVPLLGEQFVLDSDTPNTGAGRKSGLKAHTHTAESV